MTNTARQSVLFPSLLDRPVHVAFDEPATTSDGGAILLKAVDERLGLCERLADTLCDERQAGKVRHATVDLLRQRIYGLALGYEDANDVARIGADRMFRLLLGRDPVEGIDLASQPTFSRFENAATTKDLLRMGTALAETVVAHHAKRLGRRRVRRVTIDLDPTDLQTHGEQQLTIFNGHYGGYCYLPLLGFLTFNDEAEQYLYTAILRSGRAHAVHGTLGLLRRTIAHLRSEFPRAKIRVRLDGGFSSPGLYELLERAGVEYLVGIGKNKVLERRAGRLMGRARRLSRKQKCSVALFGETQYAAHSWRKHKRRVIYKAEVTRLDDREPRNNPRFVVTNLRYSPENVYKIYRARGDSENRIKELLLDLSLGRASCTRFLANQMRVFLVAASYVLLQTLRSRLSKAGLQNKRIETLRLMLLKVGAKVTSSVRRIVIHMTESHPWHEEWMIAARAWNALPT
jgi:hypothetical protein